MKAVILAAGEGRRLEPLTETRPKPMLPVANKPLLEHVVEAAVDAGIEEIVLVVGYKRERIQSYFGDGDDWAVEIEYAVQDKQLGTGHAVLQAESHLDGSFLVLNGDRVIDSTIIETMLDEDPSDEALMAITRSSQPSDYGVVEVEGEAVRSITEKPPSYATASDIINAGVYRFHPDICDVIRSTDTEGELTITAAIQRLVADDRVRAVHDDGIWLDVSYLWDYLDVNAELLDREGAPVVSPVALHPDSFVSEVVAVGRDTSVQPNATVLPGTALGDNVSVGSNAVVANSVVLPDATIDVGAVVQDCIVGENATVGANTTIEGGHAEIAIDDTVHEGVRLGGVIGGNSALGGNVTVAAGTVIGTGVTVQSGTTLSTRIPSDAIVMRG